MIKMIEPQEWDTFLNGFTERNHGRRARFEIFSHGDFSEEEREAYFENVSIDGNTVTVKRSYDKHGERATMTDTLENIRGISIQYDTDNSEDMLEFTNERNELTTLHFESRVDGDS
ncbi:MAG: hypothetical protein ABJB40_09720 [Acidobacteriota bacterium]